MLGWFIWLIVDWANDYSIITNRRAVTLEKVALLYEKKKRSSIGRHPLSGKMTGQWGRWFGFRQCFNSHIYRHNTFQTSCPS